MSFFHWTLVGHFVFEGITPLKNDDGTFVVSHSLIELNIRLLLDKLPKEIQEYIEFVGGYAKCDWARLSMTHKDVQTFAYQLAELEGCIALENGCIPGYPPKFVEEHSQLLLGMSEETKSVA